MANPKDGIPFNGFASAIELLKNSDAAFAQKILRNIAKMNPAMAERLEAALKRQGRSVSAHDLENSQAALSRSTRNAQTRNYGN